jgi:sec-independent protein translocase protein TatA
MPNIGLPEIIIVLVIALIIFGPKRLPELGQSLGRGIKEFRGSVSGEHKDDEDSVEAKKAQLEAAGGGKTDTTAETVDGEVVTENKA